MVCFTAYQFSLSKAEFVKYIPLFAKYYYDIECTITSKNKVIGAGQISLDFLNKMVQHIQDEDVVVLKTKSVYDNLITIRALPTIKEFDNLIYEVAEVSEYDEQVVKIQKLLDDRCRHEGNEILLSTTFDPIPSDKFCSVLKRVHLKDHHVTRVYYISAVPVAIVVIDDLHPIIIQCESASDTYLCIFDIDDGFVENQFGIMPVSWNDQFKFWKTKLNVFDYGSWDDPILVNTI